MRGRLPRLAWTRDPGATDDRQTSHSLGHRRRRRHPQRSVALGRFAQRRGHVGEGELAAEAIAAEVQRGMFVLAEVDQEPAGVIRFQLEDLLFWPDSRRLRSQCSFIVSPCGGGSPAVACPRRCSSGRSPTPTRSGMFDVNDQREFSNPSRASQVGHFVKRSRTCGFNTNEYRGGNAPMRSRFVFRRGSPMVPSLTYVAAAHDVERSCS